MTTSWYRIQSADRDVTELLDPAEQVSRAWAPGGDAEDDRRARHGVSVCDSLDSLASYLAGPGSGIGYGDGEWVIVELTGDQSDDEPLDAADGEYLVLPDSIVSVRPMDDDFFEMIGAAYDALCA